jgi:hypothetical protein
VTSRTVFLLPMAWLSDSQDDPNQPVRIVWNVVNDLSASKLTHISNQAFYLRRYAQRVAALWEKEYGRRPAVPVAGAHGHDAPPLLQEVVPQGVEVGGAFVRADGVAFAEAEAVAARVADVERQIESLRKKSNRKRGSAKGQTSWPSPH